MENREGGTIWTRWEDEDGAGRGMAVGAIVASAMAAGVIAYFLRRAQHEEDIRTPTGFANRAIDRTRDAMGDVSLEAGREFLAKKVVPEFKPALLAILDDLEDVVDDAFRRAEKAIKKL